MSIFGYFSKNRSQLRMPRSEAEGDVLSGKLTVEEALRRDAERAPRPAGPTRSPVDFLDPGLRHRLGFDKPWQFGETNPIRVGAARGTHVVGRAVFGPRFHGIPNEPNPKNGHLHGPRGTPTDRLSDSAAPGP
jgi:hypothetical protein